jgi:hypothetical protein
VVPVAINSAILNGRRRLLVCLWAAAQLLVAAGPALAQDTRESAVKAAFLVRFSSYVEWPPGVFQGADGALIFAVADDEVATDLEQLIAGVPVNGRPALVRRVRDGAAAGNAHIYFLGEQREGRLREALAAVPGPVLVVTEQDNGLRLGSVINFVMDRNRVRFSVSLASAEARNLKLSARLLAVAAQVEARPR